MPIPGLDPDKCQQRNRLEALRDARNAAPLRLLREGPASEDATDAQLLGTEGNLPESEAQALQRINALLPEGAGELKAEAVWIHYCEAANGNFIADRFMFLGSTTLQNIARDAEKGVAFMNSHRTGGFSEPSELPFGRTFCGRYERYRKPDGSTYERTVIGFYMLRGVTPNGANGPSTDDLHRMIAGGTLFDVSVGLWPGEEQCDVCGNGLNERDPEGRYLCPHIPGTHRAMTPAQVEQQQARGVTKGYASFTLLDYRMGEISGVYDGAVPGAGFSKAVRFSKRGDLNGEDLRAAGLAYRSLCSQHEAALFSAGLPRVSLEGVDLGFVETGRDKARELESQAPPAADTPSDSPTDSGREEAPLAGVSFGQQLDEALAALDGCIARGECLRELRAAEGRQLSPARRTQFTRLHSRLGALLAADEAAAAPDRLAELRQRALRVRAGALLSES